MPTGIVKWFNGRKGYGFIEPEDVVNEVFVHVTALKDCVIKPFVITYFVTLYRIN